MIAAVKVGNGLRMNVVSVLPESVKESLRFIRGIANTILYYGNGRYCPICGGSSRKFGKAGVVPRGDAKCMRCGALERHRFVWLYVGRMTNLLDGKPKKVLHVGPEPFLRRKFRKMLPSGYVTADLLDRGVDVRMDVTQIQFPEESFDAIYCSHVLEHVEDDRRAMREFHRVLKKDGWAILLAPITAEKTFEDPRIIDPEERLKFFGQKDHVRRYGPDYVERLREAGFRVKITCVSDLFEKDEMVRMGLTAASGEIYYCTKG